MHFKSLQEIESSSDVTPTESTPSGQTHHEAGKDAVETNTSAQQESSTVRSFREVQELLETEPHSQLLQVHVMFWQMLTHSLISV